MKVKIGKYPSWFGPYQLAEALCFWVPEVKDTYGLKDKPMWVHHFGEWLAYGSIDKDKEIFKEDRNPTLLYKFLTWVSSKNTRKIQVKIDRWDTWSMDDTLAHIVLPMLKQLKESKHGAPFVDDEDVPEELRSTNAKPKENEYDLDDNHFLRWDWVMSEMIFAFESKVDDSWKDKFASGNFQVKSVPCEWNTAGEPTLYTMEDGPEHTYKYNHEGAAIVQKRISNGFKLFGKYYESLWD